MYDQHDIFFKVSTNVEVTDFPMNSLIEISIDSDYIKCRDPNVFDNIKYSYTRICACSEFNEWISFALRNKFISNFGNFGDYLQFEVLKPFVLNNMKCLPTEIKKFK